MNEHAAIIAEPVQLRGPSTRRWDIDNAILAFLESGPKTASRLFIELNPGLRRRWGQTVRGWKRRPVNVKVDYRALKRHLGYLQRDGLIDAWPELKILHHDRGAVAWDVKYYHLQALHPSPLPSPTLLQSLQSTSAIHNPFRGEEGMLRYIRWLRDP
jgi:hypothetical protein